MDNILNYNDLFPYVKDFDLIHKGRRTSGYLKALGFFLQQAILNINEYVEVQYTVKTQHSYTCLTVYWDLDLDDKKYQINIKTSDIDDVNKFIISFRNTDRKTNKVLSEMAKGGFSINVLQNNKEIYNMFIDFLLSGKSPDLSLLDMVEARQTSLFDD